MRPTFDPRPWRRQRARKEKWWRAAWVRNAALVALGAVIPQGSAIVKNLMDFPSHVRSLEDAVLTWAYRDEFWTGEWQSEVAPIDAINIGLPGELAGDLRFTLKLLSEHGHIQGILLSNHLCGSFDEGIEISHENGLFPPDQFRFQKWVVADSRRHDLLLDILRYREEKWEWKLTPRPPSIGVRIAGHLVDIEEYAETQQIGESKISPAIFLRVLKPGHQLSPADVQCSDEAKARWRPDDYQEDENYLPSGILHVTP